MTDMTHTRPVSTAAPSQLSMLDEKLPISPTEPPSPPRAYDPHSIERSGHHATGEALTAVNSIALEGGLRGKEGHPVTQPIPETEPDTQPSELPLVVRPFSATMRKHLMSEIDPNMASFPLAAYCFMTGYVSQPPPLSPVNLLTLWRGVRIASQTDAITYTAAYVWSAFQTGNTIQCGMAIAKLFTKYPHPVTDNPWPTTVPEEVKWNPLAAEQWVWRRDYGLKTSDAQALASLLCFLFGAFCGRLGDKIGPKKRAWLIVGTFIQAAFTLASALCAWANGKISL